MYNEMNEVYFTILAILIAIIAVYLLDRNRRKKSVNVLLLTGLSGSGKTALFTKLVFNKQKKSFSSLRENEAHNKELNLRIIDIPGSERLRNHYWERFRSQARHVIVVIDSVDFESKIRDISEHLYHVLSDSNLYKNKIMCTIACNKQDVTGAKSKREIGESLEKELNAIKRTKKGQLSKTSNEEDDDYILNNFDDVKQINFSKLNVKLIDTSMHNLENLMKLII